MSQCNRCPPPYATAHVRPWRERGRMSRSRLGCRRRGSRRAVPRRAAQNQH